MAGVGGSVGSRAGKLERGGGLEPPPDLLSIVAPRCPRRSGNPWQHPRPPAAPEPLIGGVDGPGVAVDDDEADEHEDEGEEAHVLLPLLLLLLLILEPWRTSKQRTAPHRTPDALRATQLRCALLRSAAIKCNAMRSAAMHYAALCCAQLRSIAICCALLRCAARRAAHRPAALRNGAVRALLAHELARLPPRGSLTVLCVNVRQRALWLGCMHETLSSVVFMYGEFRIRSLQKWLHCALVAGRNRLPILELSAARTTCACAMSRPGGSRVPVPRGGRPRTRSTNTGPMCPTSRGLPRSGAKALRQPFPARPSMPAAEFLTIRVCARGFHRPPPGTPPDRSQHT